jgi:hypothetical protein
VIRRAPPRPAEPQRVSGRGRVSAPAPRRPASAPAAAAPPAVADTLARTLAHVVDTRRGGGLLARTASVVNAPGGTFRARQYDVLQPEEAGDHVGAQISLEFCAAAPVEGRIGLIQIVDHGEDAWIDAPKTLRGKPKDQAVKWGEYVAGQSPVFGALRDPRKPASDKPLTIAHTTQPSEVLDLWETAAHTGASSKEAEEAHDQTYTSKRGKSKIELEGAIQTGERRGSNVTPASLTDRPGFGADQPHAKQLVTWNAETAAVVLDGPWGGAYLGSVRWGWRSEPQDGGLPKVSLVPDTIALVSTTVPSDAFIKAGLRWNKTLTLEDPLGKHAIVPVPVPANIWQFERWDLDARGDDELLRLKNWLVQNWQKVIDKSQLRLVAWRLAPIMKARDLLLDGERFLKLIERQKRLEGLVSLEDLVV